MRLRWVGDLAVCADLPIKHVLCYDGAERASEQQEQQRRQARGQVARCCFRCCHCRVCAGRRGGLAHFHAPLPPDLLRMLGLHAAVSALALAHALRGIVASCCPLGNATRLGA